MNFKLPFLHKHYLLYDENEKQEAFCNECNQQIVGFALTCEQCKFWLHQSCAEQKLPCKISHPLHSQQTLQLKFGLPHFICGKCLNLSNGYGYREEYNSLKLDVICALSTDNQTLHEESERSKGIGKKIEHFCHEHSLTLFNYRKVSKNEYCCSWCDQPLSGVSYGCLDNYCFPFFLHQLCLYKIPNKILEHPFHPSHQLFLNFSWDILTCRACEQPLFKGFVYSCERCDFQLHVLCAKLEPTLRHECHDHCLTYIRIPPQAKKKKRILRILFSYSRGQKSNSWVGNESTIYRCVQCNCNFRFDCLIPSTIKHEYHQHSLTVMNEFREDYSGKYYCDICEKQRDPDHHVYCCKECMYTAHVECALGKAVDAKSSLMLTSKMKHEESQQLFKDFKHKHPLIFKEIKDIKLPCQACDLEVSGQAYVCEQKKCRYYLHKSCGELPSELLHPHHSLDHPLILVTGNSSGQYSGHFICDKCRGMFRGFMYRCFLCNLKLDIECVVSTASKLVNQREGTKQIERPSVTITTHFCHEHDLVPVNIGATNERRCKACLLNISGPAYHCLEGCEFFVHESCLGKLPKEIQIPSHRLYFMGTERYAQICLICRGQTLKFHYKCYDCQSYTHFLCASSLKNPLCSISHPHNLYLLHWDKMKRVCEFQQLPKCSKCNSSLVNKSIYCCLECHCFFHLQCVEEISYRFKSKYHIHPLTLKDGHDEDDYCDICEQQRDPKDDVYYCQECNGMFVSHVNCAVTQVEEMLQKYGPAPYSPPETLGDNVVVDQ